MHRFNICVSNAMTIHRVLYIYNNNYHELYIIIIILNDFYVHGHASKHIYYTHLCAVSLFNCLGLCALILFL